MKKWFGIFALCFLLTACGFQPRSSDFSIPIKIVNQGASPEFYAAFKHAVHAHHHHAQLKLILLKDNLIKKTNSLTSSIRVRDETLIYEVHYQVNNGPLRSIVVTHHATINTNQLLSVTYMEESIVRELQEDVIRQIIARVAHHHEITH